MLNTFEIVHLNVMTVKTFLTLAMRLLPVIHWAIDNLALPLLYWAGKWYRVYKKVIQLWRVIVHYILQTSIYFFHTNKDQALIAVECRNATFFVSLRSRIAKYDPKIEQTCQSWVKGLHLAWFIPLYYAGAEVVQAGTKQCGTTTSCKDNTII